MLSAPSQLVLRNRECFAQGRWLLVNPQDSQIFNELSGLDVQGFHQFYDQFQQCQQHCAQPQHFAASFSEEVASPQAFDGALVYLPKAKQHTQMLLADIANSLRPGATLMLVGENKGGAKSAGKLLAAYGESVHKLDSARHCTLFTTEVNQQVAPFSLAKWQRTVPVSIKNIKFQIVTLPGVFSHGELDAATRLLLENAPPAANGNVLDFACGAGPIGCYLALTHPQAAVIMSDINALALYCAKQSALLNKVKAEVVASNGLQQIPGNLVAIYTNPPFHTGIKTDYQITGQFLQQISAHLLPGGQLTLVANRFLPYPELIRQHLGNCTNLAKTNKFSLYGASRHRK